ncbi:CBS domain-containing protein [Lutibacter agarilyticus]|uniref:CBS domain-containing protein n=1 Tax=Lutibacter agarilyticus TaxID=1109740 RepID=A0A238WNN6_9FLAO|nr:CBS domain-containing protein [Lutibacter agarilyticus]SNR48125.1 CBS domain-containing protein [Lutibacter agarilyticus]
MKRLEPISKIMTRELITLSLSDDLYKAEKLFKKHHIRHIPIVEEEHIIGILSYSDLKRISFLDSYDSHEVEVDNAIYNMLSIQQLMVKNIVKVNSSITVKSVVEILAKNEFHALPVVENDILVGIVTTTDLLKYLLDQYELDELAT